MGIETRAFCDVRGTYRDVKHIRLMMVEVTQDDDGEEETAGMGVRDAWLSPPAIERLISFVNRGLHRPDWKPPVIDDATDDPTPTQPPSGKAKA